MSTAQSTSFTDKLSPVQGLWAFASKVGQTFLSKGFLLVTGLGVNVLIARTLGPEGQGTYASLVALGGMGVQIGNLGLHSSNTYFSAKDSKLLPFLLGNSLLVLTVMSLLLAVGIEILSRTTQDFIPVAKNLLPLALLYIPAALGVIFFQGLLMGRQLVAAYNKIEIGQRILGIALLACLVFGNIKTVESFFGALIVATYASAFLSLWVLYRSGGAVVPKASQTLLRRTSKFGVNAYAAAVFSFLTLKFNLLMVNGMMSAKSAGYYSIALSIGDVIYMLPGVVGLILFAKLSSVNSGNERRDFLSRVLKILVPLMLTMVIIADFAIYPFIKFLYGEKYMASIEPFLWMSPGIYFLSLATVVQNYLGSTGRAWAMIIGPLVACCVNVVLTYSLIPSYGIKGAAISSSVAYISWFTVGIFLVIKVKGIEFSNGEVKLV
ncbi:MAG: polysaccharide biosynthesis C-terminal domain-containing protein [Bdellovibrionales bacterium]|nr:polysaccharide biosynthesis C-terminal domain-containing protein [Bdellovibrionales bacterium]